MKQPLVIGNGAAILLVAAMSDLEPLTRVGIGAALAVNVLFLLGRDALVTAPARIAAKVSLGGYIATVASWLILALGCGIEYYNARCDAVVEPAIFAFAAIAVISVPVGRIIGFGASSPPRRNGGTQ